MINLGDRVRESITGFAGIVTARYEYLYGCVRVAVQPEKLAKDGKYQEALVFDEDQVVVVKANAVVGVAAKSKPTTGGPRSAVDTRNEQR
jgi:hypothetical protein